MGKRFAWSFSALEGYELCPKKYYCERVGKTHKGKTNAVQAFGIEAHAAFEKRMMVAKELPLDLVHHEKFLAKLDKIPGESFGEQKLAITRDMEPTGFFDSDVWCRAVLDFMKVSGSSAVLFDWKFGKMKDGFDQLELAAAIISCFKPEIRTFHLIYYWAKEKTPTSKRLIKSDMPVIWTKFLNRVNKMETSFANDDFPATQNFLCRKYCPVKECPHNGI